MTRCRARLVPGWSPLLALAFWFLPGATPVLARAPIDSLDVRTVLERRNAELDSLLFRESLAPDSSDIHSRARDLDSTGVEGLRALGRADRPAGFQAGGPPDFAGGYNRVEGYRLGLSDWLAWRRIVRLQANVHYSVEPHRWGGASTLNVGGQRSGPGARLSWSESYRPFGPNELPFGAAALALLAGQDRCDHLRRRELSLRVWPWRTAGASAWIESFDRRDWAARARTDAHLFGGATPIERPNPLVDELKIRGAAAGLGVQWRGDLFTARGEFGVAGGSLGGDRDFNWQEASLALRPVFPDGGILTLHLEGRNTGGSPPLQSAPYLGGDHNLRGYQHLEFTGRRMAALRVEYEVGLDLLARSRIPVLRRLHLQFIPFADLGSTWGTPAGIQGVEALEGEVRSSFGLGLRRAIWLPGAAAVRLDLIRRADGRDDDLKFLFRIEPF